MLQFFSKQDFNNYTMYTFICFLCPILDIFNYGYSYINQRCGFIFYHSQQEKFFIVIHCHSWNKFFQKITNFLTALCNFLKVVCKYSYFAPYYFCPSTFANGFAPSLPITHICYHPLNQLGSVYLDTKHYFWNCHWLFKMLYDRYSLCRCLLFSNYMKSKFITQSMCFIFYRRNTSWFFTLRKTRSERINYEVLFQ